MTLRVTLAALAEERHVLVTQIQRAFRQIEQLVEEAYAAHAAGDLPEARILLNEALDVECDVTGDTVVLSDLFDEWGGDYERDRRVPSCSAAPDERLVSLTGDSGECQRCGETHMGYCRQRTCTGLTEDGECDNCGVLHKIGTECP